MVLLERHRRRGRRKLEVFNRVIELVIARGAQLGNRDGARLHDDAIGRFQIAFAFEDRAVLFQRQVNALRKRKWFREPVRSALNAIRFRGGQRQRRQKQRDREGTMFQHANG